jgi:hypothetical protein
MKVIWKYEVPVSDESVEITMPINARVVHVDSQKERIVSFWILADPEIDLELSTFKVFGTGHGIDDKYWGYVGTAFDKQFVWHLFEKKR